MQRHQHHDRVDGSRVVRNWGMDGYLVGDGSEGVDGGLSTLDQPEDNLCAGGGKGCWACVGEHAPVAEGIGW